MGPIGAQDAAHGEGLPEEEPFEMPGADEVRPKKLPSTQVSRQVNARGETVYVLHNPETESYLEVDERNFFLWEQMTGDDTLWELSLNYYMEYRSFPVDRLGPLLEALKTNHLLAGSEVEGGAPDERARPPQLSGRLQEWARATFQKTFPIRDADRFYDALYRRGGRLLLSRPALLIYLAVSLAGFACFLVSESRMVFRPTFPDASLGISVALVLLFTLVMVFVHESAHALMCKRIGRRVLGAGFMFYYGMPAFFVDVTDTWMSGKGGRIAVALAGPASTALLGGVLAFAAVLAPGHTAALALYQMTCIAYLSVLFNLNPLLELDGYYVLEDLLGINRLRQKAFAFLRRVLWGKLRRREAFGREDLELSVFGLMSLAYTAFAIWFALYLWRTHMKAILLGLREGHDPLALVLLGGLTVAAGTALVVGLAARLLLWADAGRRNLARRIRRLQGGAR